MFVLEIRGDGIQLIFRKDTSKSEMKNSPNDETLILPVNLTVTDGRWHSVEILIFPSHLSLGACSIFTVNFTIKISQ